MAHQHHQSWPLSRFWPPASDEALEKDAVQDDGKPDCETVQEVTDDDDGNGQSRGDVVSVSDDLATHESNSRDTYGR